MEKTNTTRISDERQSKDSDFDYYLKSGLPVSQVASLLRTQGKDQKEIDAFVEKYEVARKKIAKVVKKFAEKIEQKYGHLDIPELIKKGMKFASKHNLSSAERDAFVRYVMKGDTETPYMPFQELGYTEMSKFLGFSNFVGQTIAVKATDHPALHEIARLYELSKPIHSAIKTNSIMYKPCSVDAVSGQFNRDKDNVNMFIHPLIVALFLSKIDPLEKRMLFSNIGRLVVQRTQAYFQTSADKTMSSKYANWHLSLSDLLPGELRADFELAYDIAKDPNSLNYFSDETPMQNLLKRYNVQIELWKNILSLRQGKYYSRSDYFNIDDGIMGLNKVLASYDWTYFDSPDLYQVQDEGNMLRKILAVFSFRPTFTQLSTFVHRTGLGGYSNIGAARATYVNIPVCNIRLPVNIYGKAQAPVRLESALTQSDWYIENKMLVPKNKAVIYSRKIIFFYVNRRYHSPLANLDMSLSYLTVPGTVTGMTSINTTELHFEPDIRIGNDKFCLTSVVVLNPLLEGQLSTGCSAIVLSPLNMAIGKNKTDYYYYNPLLSGIQYKDEAGKYTRNDPISVIPEDSMDPSTIGFYGTARKYGTIFVFVNDTQTD